MNIYSIIFLITFSFCNAQIEEKEFIILSIEYDADYDNHAVLLQYYVTEYNVDSQDIKLQYYPLIINPNSTDQFFSCCNGKPSYPQSFFTEEKSEFPVDFYSHVDEQEALIKKHRVKLQTLKKEWETFKETTIVYATIVKTKFCFCESLDQHFQHPIYLRQGEIKLSRKIPENHVVRKQDFAAILNRYGW